MSTSPVYKKILLKLSGESLTGEGEFGIDATILNKFATEVGKAHKLGVQIGIVIGGGNIFRGVEGETRGIPRTAGDQMGMLATVINSIALLHQYQRPIKHKGNMRYVEVTLDDIEVANKLFTLCSNHFI